jgi:hypothetical protein
MNCIAAEFAVEVLVHFKESDGNSPARQEKSKYRTGRASPHNAA